MSNQTIRIDTAADLASLTVDADTTRLVISMPTSFVGDPSEGAYDADTEALWTAIQADLKAKGWEWTGSAGIEEDGSGDWLVFRARSLRCVSDRYDRDGGTYSGLADFMAMCEANDWAADLKQTAAGYSDEEGPVLEWA